MNRNSRRNFLKLSIKYSSILISSLAFFTNNYIDSGLLIKDNVIINPLTNKSPSFLHGPGNLNLDKYCRLLNYPIRTIKRNQNI